MSTIRVTCPRCKEVMEIETRTGKVLKHHGEIAGHAEDDSLAARIRELDEQKKRREAVVAESRAKEKSRKAAHEELFSKVKKTAAEGPAEKPVRDIDFD
jgi:hypothetical protein